MLGVVVFYLTFTSLVALITVRKVEALEEFTLAGRRLGYLYLVPLFMAELVGGASTVGMAELAYKVGISSVWFNLSMALGCVVVAYLASGWYRESGITTVPEAFSKLFDERCRLVVLVLFCVVYFVLFSVEVAALGALLAPISGLSATGARILAAFLFLLLSATAGLWSVAWCNMIHALAIYGGMFLALFLVLGGAGGWHGVLGALPPHFFRPLSLGPARILAWLVGLPLAFVVSQPMIQSVASALDPIKARRALVVASLMIVMLALSVAFTGMAARVVYPHIPPRQLLFFIARSAPGPLGGLVLSGILAALLSTAPVLLLALATIVGQDLMVSLFPHLAPRVSLVGMRAIMVVGTLLSLLVAPKIRLILGTLMDAFQIRAVVGMVFLLGLRWKGMDSFRAFWSMVVAGAGGVGWVLLGKPWGVEPLYLSLLLGTAVIFFPGFRPSSRTRES